MDPSPTGPIAEPPRSGLFDSVRRLLARVLALAQTRLELLTTELAIEVQRAVSVLLWAFMALFFGALLGGLRGRDPRDHRRLRLHDHLRR